MSTHINLSLPITTQCNLSEKQINRLVQALITDLSTSAKTTLAAIQKDAIGSALVPDIAIGKPEVISVDKARYDSEMVIVGVQMPDNPYSPEPAASFLVLTRRGDEELLQQLAQKYNATCATLTTAISETLNCVDCIFPHGAAMLELALEAAAKSYTGRKAA